MEFTIQPDSVVYEVKGSVVGEKGKYILVILRFLSAIIIFNQLRKAMVTYLTSQFTQVASSKVQTCVQAEHNNIHVFDRYPKGYR